MAFDVDGTLLLEGEPLPWAAEAVAAIRHCGLQVFFTTNASGRTRAQIAAALRAAGVAASEDEVLSSASVTAAWLVARGVRRAWILGASGLRAELAEAGVAEEDDPQLVEAVVVGLDRAADPTLEPVALPEALVARLAAGGCLLVGCNRDRTYPGPGARPRPGCGEVLARVEALSGRVADVAAGKPDPAMLETVAAAAGLDMREVLVVGDSWTSDVAMARACGAPWAYVPVPGGEPQEPPADAVADPGGRVLATIAELPALVGCERPRG